jgi:hypothetical protein
MFHTHALAEVTCEIAMPRQPISLKRKKSDAGSESGEDFLLEQGHRLHSHRPAIVDFVFESIEKNAHGATYKEPPRDQPAPLCRDNRYFHLACPYYLLRPGEYQACLLDHCLLSIGALIRHLIEGHVEPPYCPKCCRIFECSYERDAHLDADGCEWRSRPVDSVNLSQREELVKGGRVGDCEQDRWLHIWRTVFEPSDSPPALPSYLCSGAGLAISATHDFSKESGRSLTVGYLEDAGIWFTAEEADDLSQCVLQDILKRLLDQERNVAAP